MSKITSAILGLLLFPALRCSAVQQSPHVSFQYSIDPVTASILRGRRIHVVLRNEGTTDVSIIRIQLKLDADLLNARRDLDNAFLPCSGHEKSNSIEEQLAAGKEVELVFDYPTGSFSLPLWNLDLATFEPGVHKLEFRAQVQNPVTNIIVPLAKSVDLDVQAPPLGIILGGAIGALIFTLVRAAYHRSRKDCNKPPLLTELYQAGWTILAGGLIALILTFAGGLLSNRIIGLQIAATSFKGGVIIGLCSFKLGDVLAKALWV
jgi:hypothetical protein